jgi:peroxin-5
VCVCDPLTLSLHLCPPGDYERSARFYVRALGLNPAASHVWGYLRTSLACGGKMELMSAVDRQDLAALQAALPL